LHHSELLDAFHLRLGRLTHASAQLDFNIGLSLGWLGPHNNNDVSKWLEPKKSQLGQRIEKLEELIKKTYDQAQPQLTSDFDAWFRRSEKARALRNDFIHARWGLPGELNGEEPYVFFLALNWDMSLDRPDRSIRLTLNEFDRQIAEVNKLAGDFVKLHHRHAKHAIPAAWWRERNSDNSDQIPNSDS
jgi:hypothetical protein